MQSTQIEVTDPVTTAHTLRSAALYLNRYGWVQGSYYDFDAQVFTPAACTVGAIGMVCYGGPVEAPAQHFDDPGFAEFEAAVVFLDGYLSDRWLADTAYQFNDAKGRHVLEVLHALREAADLWDRNRGGVR